MKFTKKDRETHSFQECFDEAFPDGCAEEFLEEAKRAYFEAITFVAGMHPGGVYAVIEDFFYMIGDDGTFLNGLRKNPDDVSNDLGEYEFITGHMEGEVNGGGPTFTFVKSLEEFNALER